MLAQAIERHGLATVQLASVRTFVERLPPPRALYCEFPLGRPLGRPGDPAFQRRVLLEALVLLERADGPVLEDFPERIVDEADTPLECAVPPRFDPSLSPEVDEALALRAAYDRQRASTGRTNVGHAVDADGISDAVAAVVRIADGTPLAEAGLPGSPRSVGLDVRAYYEEAALALADHVPEARRAEAWVYRRTRTGAALLRARQRLREAGEPEPVWRFFVPDAQVEAVAE